MTDFPKNNLFPLLPLHLKKKNGLENKISLAPNYQKKSGEDRFSAGSNFTKNMASCFNGNLFPYSTLLPWKTWILYMKLCSTNKNNWPNLPTPTGL